MRRAGLSTTRPMMRPLCVAVVLLSSAFYCALCDGKEQQKHVCIHGHREVKLTPGVRLSAGETDHASKRQAMAPIRFSAFYDRTIDSSRVDPVRDMIQEVVPAVLEDFSQFVSVVPVQGSLLLDRDCSSAGGYYPPVEGSNVRRCSNLCIPTMCGDAVVPGDHLKRCIECRDSDPQDLMCVLGNPSTDGAGVTDTDFVVYVSAVPCIGANTLASASACQMESELDRPIAGNINFCPDNLEGTNRDFLYQVTKHELMHALAFSSSLMPFWRDSSGEPRTPRDGDGFPPLNAQRDGYKIDENTVKNTTYSDWDTISGTVPHRVTLLGTEAVLSEGKAHFDCKDLEGVELENQGDSGTALQHWEKRVLGNEAMTGVFDFNPTFSRLTLAVLEDSGWYSVDYAAASTLLWGRERGCQFVLGGCGGMLNQEPYCGKDIGDRTLGCTLDRGSVATCNLEELKKEVPGDYRYLDGDIGGSLGIADYCPYYREFTQASGRTGNCTNSQNQPDSSTNSIFRGEDVFGEKYGPNSVCLQQGRAWEKMFTTGTRTTSTLSVGSFGGGCYEIRCSAGEGLTIFVRGVPFKCECEGQELVVDVLACDTTFTGSVICPACTSVCDQRNCPSSEPASCPSVRSFPQQKVNCSMVGSTTPPNAAPAAILTLVLMLLLAVIMQ